MATHRNTSEGVWKSRETDGKWCGYEEAMFAALTAVGNKCLKFHAGMSDELSDKYNIFNSSPRMFAQTDPGQSNLPSNTRRVQHISNTGHTIWEEPNLFIAYLLYIVAWQGSGVTSKTVDPRWTKPFSSLYKVWLLKDPHKHEHKTVTDTCINLTAG